MPTIPADILRRIVSARADVARIPTLPEAVRARASEAAARRIANVTAAIETWIWAGAEEDR